MVTRIVTRTRPVFAVECMEFICSFVCSILYMLSAMLCSSACIPSVADSTSPEAVSMEAAVSSREPAVLSICEAVSYSGATASLGTSGSEPSEDAKELGIGIMSFGPGGRTKMHTHTSEQILFITEGRGLVGTENEEIEVKPGMMVFFPAGEKHFHGATADSPVSHLTIAPPHKTDF